MFENKNELIYDEFPKRKVHRYFEIQTGLLLMGEKREIRGGWATAGVDF